MATPQSLRASLDVEALESRELLSASALLPIQTFDTTAVKALPANWSQWNSQEPIAVSASVAKSGHNGLAASGVSGQESRAWYDVSQAANLQVSAALRVDSLVPGQILARGSHLDSATPSYYAVAVTRGLQVQLLRVVAGKTTVLGLIRSDRYFSNLWVQATLVVSGPSLKAQIYRSDTHQYLNSFGRWQSTPAWAIIRSDRTIGGTGLVGLARPGSHAGTVWFDDFKVTGIPTNQRVAPPVFVQQSFDRTAPGALPSHWEQWTNQESFQVEAVKGLQSRQGLESIGGAGQSARAWLNAVQPANVQASAAVLLDSLVPAEVMIRGTGLNSSRPSYYAVEVTRGLRVQLVRVRDGVAVSLGSVQSRHYVSGPWIQVTIAAQGSALRAQVYRLDTRQYLNSGGHWQSDATWALERTDTLLRGPGQVGLARPASYRGTLTFDNFTVSAPASTQGGRKTPPSPRSPGHDTQPPAISISGVRNGGVVFQPTVVRVNAADKNGVAQVDFFLDNRHIAVDLAAPYDWVLDPSGLADGPHRLTVLAVDPSGNIGKASLQVLTRKLHPQATDVNIPRHYQHIRIAELAYNPTPLGAFEQQLLRTSVDLVVPDDVFAHTIHQIAPSTPQLVYTNFSTLYLGLLTDWLDYADAHGLKRESAFYHVSHSTRFTGDSPSSQPVDWFWGVYQDTPRGLANLTTAAHAVNQDVHFGTRGTSLYLGYTDPFREINLNLVSGARSGWSAILEIPTAVDRNGHPIAWAPLTTLSNGTAGLKHSGQITFDPPANWKMAALNDTTRLYYVRVRTLSDGGAPVARTILGRDYVNAHGTHSGTIPAFDTRADLNHDGYLNDREYTHRTPGMDARFLYESRDFAGYGQMRPPTNPVSAGFRAWAVDYSLRFLQHHSEASGLFVDNSAGKQPVNDTDVVESLATYSTDYGALLGAVGRAIAPRWILANTAGGQTNADGVVRQNTAYYEEFALRPLSSDYVQFEDQAAQVAHRASLRPGGFAVLDSLPRGGSPLDARTQITTLAYYYLLADPVHTFLNFFGGFEPSTSWIRHWSAAVAFDVGQPQGTWSLFATGHDPANHALTYRVYQRSYTNALVLYKPLSHAQGSRAQATLGSASGTTFRLNGSYRLLQANGTLGARVTSVTLRNGEGAILVKG
jgi:hypothetical protein